MEFKGVNSVFELIELIKKSEYEEDADGVLVNQFIDNATIKNLDPQPYIDNDGIGYYEYGSETGYDAGKDYLVLDGSGVVNTTVEIKPLLSAVDKPHLSGSPEELKQAIQEFFLDNDNRSDTEFIIGEIIGDEGKPALDEALSDMYDEQHMRLVIDDIVINNSDNEKVNLDILVSWK